MLTQLDPKFKLSMECIMQVIENVKTLTDAKNKVKVAWVAAFGVAGMTLALIASNMASGNEIAGVGSPAWTLIDVMLTLIFGVGIYRYSRWCAVLMFAYYSIDKLITIFVLKQTPSVLAIVFLVCFFQGIQGTFVYHRLKRQAEAPITE
jgi:hypothetical protein